MFKQKVLKKYEIVGSVSELKKYFLIEAKKPEIFDAFVREIKNDAPDSLLNELKEYDVEYTKQEYKKNPKKIIKHWFDIAFNSFLKNLGRIKFQADSILLYRKLGVDNINEFMTLLREGKFPSGYKGVGVCWGYDKEVVESWGFQTEGEEEAIFTAKVSIKNIDFKKTLIAQCHPLFGSCESEINLKKGIPIEIIAVDGKKISPIKTKT